MSVIKFDSTLEASTQFNPSYGTSSKQDLDASSTVPIWLSGNTENNENLVSGTNEEPIAPTSNFSVMPKVRSELDSINIQKYPDTTEIDSKNTKKLFNVIPYNAGSDYQEKVSIGEHIKRGFRGAINWCIATDNALDNWEKSSRDKPKSPGNW